ncbi:MAG TPA: DUF2203 domain-containing protein [bacterium]|nr:DUF2203 domain-containing protein [bacterium]
MLVSRLFTVREANAFVPRLQEIFTEARGMLEHAQTVARELADLGAPIEDVDRLAEDPQSTPAVRAKQRDIAATIAALRTTLREVAEMGAEVKAADGLVDFRSRRHGDVVYLCWRFGEPEIRHWHAIDTGFAGRAAISDPAEFEGDLLQ